MSFLDKNIVRHAKLTKELGVSTGPPLGRVVRRTRLREIVKQRTTCISSDYVVLGLRPRTTRVTGVPAGGVSEEVRPL